MPLFCVFSFFPLLFPHPCLFLADLSKVCKGANNRQEGSGIWWEPLEQRWSPWLSDQKSAQQLVRVRQWE